jgi:ribosome-associated heat shock protein Hsp15
VSGDEDGPAVAGALRLDRWLWHARFIRTRDLAADLVAERRLRLNSQVVTKTHALVRPGDVITLTQPRAVRVLRVKALGERRGPAPEAQGLYEDLEG